MKECENEAAADDDPSPVLEHGLDKDDDEEGDVLLARRHHCLQLGIGVENGGPAVVIFLLFS